jgi:hypothetical protein
MDQTELQLIVRNAVQVLYAENLKILQFDVAERTICGQLADILKKTFDRHDVHTEYNKHGVEPKAVDLPDAEGVLTRRFVYPDIIVHQPGQDRENLLVIEVKKTTNPTSDDADLTKLAQIKNQLGYKSALFLRLSTGAAADCANVREIWVD